MEPKTVLVVDDANIVRQLCMLTLMRMGYTVILAVNGMDALKKLHDTKVDLVITDVNMPEMNGIQLIRSLRQLPQTKSTPIIVLTTLSLENHVNEGMVAGANAWIYKPFDANMLMRTVWRFR
ncbi:MAG TPA: response regulator [Geobacterales bacterium]|jgi:two-component system chemotaxis response regulator CheY|nr:response regulator [Geobacterales bacterium]